MAVLSFTALLIVTVGFLVFSIVTRYGRWRRLCHIPGPPGTGWSSWWIFRQVLVGRLCTSLDEACDKYGPLVRIAPKYVVCSDPAEIRRIWSLRSGYYRSTWYKAVRIDLTKDSVLSIIDNKEHHRLRNSLGPGYSIKGVENKVQLLDEQVVKLISLIKNKYVSTPTELRPWDMTRCTQYFTQDVITAVGLGQAMGYLDADKDIYGLFAAFQSVIMPLHVLAMLPNVLGLATNPIFKPFIPKATDKKGPGRLMGKIKEHVDKRYGPKKIRNSDALQLFVESGLSQDEVEVEALVQLLSGTDTTATALRNTIYLVTSTPSAYCSLRAEIDSAVKDATRPVISDDHARQLPFLQACLKETLRLWPPIMGLMGKVSDQDDVICGYKVPAQTQVMWAPLPMMKNREVFGQDAQIFEPRRWLDADPEKLKMMDATQGLVFASGTRWECMGKRLAMMEMGKVIFELFRRFDFAMLNPLQPFTWHHYGLTVQKNMNVKVTLRDLVDGE